MITTAVLAATLASAPMPSAPAADAALPPVESLAADVLDAAEDRADFRFRLATAADTGDLDAAARLLPELFAPGSIGEARAEALGAAATAAVAAGEIETAFAYLDWQAEEFARVAPDDRSARAAVFARAVRLAADTGAQVRTLDYARAWAAAAPDIRDDPAAGAIGFAHVAARCPDRLAWRLVRAEAIVEPRAVAALAPVVCRYTPLPGGAVGGLDIRIAKGASRPLDVADALAEGRLVWRDPAATAAIPPGGSPQRVIRTAPRVADQPSRITFVEHARPGQPEAMIEGVIAIRVEETLVAAIGWTRDPAWPPTELQAKLTEAVARAIGPAPAG